MAEKKQSLTEIDPEKLVALLKNSGSKMVSLDLLNQDFESGAPRNENGTVNLLDYAAWLVRRGEDDGKS